jgi:nicotinate-nucleotide--dimethylbenzimidazole phosphoribosyltransferase
LLPLDLARYSPHSQSMTLPTDFENAARNRLDGLAKPRGSLGRLEDLAIILARIQRSDIVTTRPRRLVLFAGDHGVVESGVSAWPSAVTALMIATIIGGGAASSVLARETDADLRIIDVGSLGDTPINPPAFYRDARVRHGSRNLAHEAALTLEEFDAAWAVGADEAKAALHAGFRIIAAGEMGIGNTTAAACLTILIAGVPIDQAVGRGAGADDAVMTAKRRVVSAAVEREANREIKAAIAALCGLEITAMAGFFATAATLGLVILLDGYVTTAAALIAERLCPGTARAMIAGHQSAEPGHAKALASLGLEPLLHFDMRLGEGTGALTAMPLLDAAAAIFNQMASLEDVGVARCD